MGDRATLALAKKELEDLYLGVPDDSVNLTFQDFAQVRQQQHNNNAEIKKLSPSPSVAKSPLSSPLTKLPSLDFSKGWEQSLHHHRRRDDHHLDHVADQRSMAYDDMSHISGTTMAYGHERGGRGRRRPGIPHSNICALCCDYIYIWRHRCLVCGRVYCRQCLSIGMGEMTEGRKCTDCLGRRFSQRYIHKAGNTGCCNVGYPSVVKQRELEWAERGARRSGENRYGNSVMVSRSRSPIGLTTPSRHHASTTPPSFVMTSPYSSPSNHHPMPF